MNAVLLIYIILLIVYVTCLVFNILGLYMVENKIAFNLSKKYFLNAMPYNIINLIAVLFLIIIKAYSPAILFFISIILIPFLIATIIFITKGFSIKNKKQNEIEIENKRKLNEVEILRTKINENKINYCQYCGCKIDKNDKKCSNCGSNIKQNT